MPELPLLFFPQPASIDRRRLPGGGTSLSKPTAAQQKQRLDARFQQVANSFQNVQTSAVGMEPEYVIVFETIGDTVDDVAKAAAKIPGLEWLAELDLGDNQPQSGFADPRDATRRLPSRLYALLSNQQSIQQLLVLWNAWCSNPAERARQGFGPFKHLFENLKDVRRWNAEDRIAATGILDNLQFLLAAGQQTVQLEVELWCRTADVFRTVAYNQVAALVEGMNGRCITQFALPAILYHGVLVELPAKRVQELVNEVLQQQYGPLLQCEQIMFFRPFGQASVVLREIDEPPTTLRERMAATPPPVGTPFVALLDGLPLEQHVALRNRLVLDDPEDHRARYEYRQQQHGTAMASLIVHGDLGRTEPALRRPLYVRPIYEPQTDWNGMTAEITPQQTLLVDLLHRAVRRIVVGDNGAPAAPDVRVINLSFGNPYQPFDRQFSPLGRLLDYLAWKHRLLFLVSAGNQTGDITLDLGTDEGASLDAGELLSRTLHFLRDQQFARRPYSPAESMNSLTVGAVHTDDSAPRAMDRRVDLLEGARLPSPISTVAQGFRRSVKPDVLFPGGRQLYQQKLATVQPTEFSVAQSFSPPGHLVASPGPHPMALEQTVHTRGTSNATALATRCAALIRERLEELRTEPGGDQLGTVDWPVLLKCLLVHGASWGAASEQLERVFEESIRRAHGTDRLRATLELKRLKSRFLGFGEVDPQRCQFCTDQRVTLVGWGKLQADSAHRYQVPVPSALHALKVPRRVTITLAWLTPIHVRHQNYRQASLWLSVPADQLGTSTSEVDADAAQRGTVEHRVFDGRKAKIVDDGDVLNVDVSCTHDAGMLAEEVPYALAVSLEMMEPIQVSIYHQVQERIRQRIGIALAS